jgi:meso-butanediol dehydrogenase/(S,S)-butanediol dehydrogenase/diacetyl reductase
VAADVERDADVEALLRATLDAHGRLDILVNNAGAVLDRVPVGDTRIEDWQRTLDLNLTTTFRVSKAALPALGESHGVILNVASVSGLKGNVSNAAYNAAKAGVINLTRVTAIEYAARGIRVNCVCPGAIDTPLLRPSLAIPGFADTTTAMIPMRRLGRPEEMAACVLFLASDLASYVTGAALVADGGLTAQTGLPSRIPLP